MLENVSEEYRKQEDENFNSICSCLNSKNSFVFNAGAGSGKTYALVECIKYLCVSNGKKLNENNQFIICITYTNVAANEIKGRLGNNSVVKVSTIHERIWDFIKKYQKELVGIHLEYIEDQIRILEEKISNDKEFQKYRELSESDKTDFTNMMILHKSEYYDAYDMKSAEFCCEIKTFALKYKALLKNVSYFKKVVNTLFTIDNYQKCITAINDGEKDYQKVIYDTLSNRDRLHQMKISHDTLLEYGYRMMQKYVLLRRVIVDKYPYILIDEYQDTSEKVVRIMKLLHAYSLEMRHPIVVGYFGDYVQNIYDSGVGKRLLEFHAELYEINKNFNRRSCEEIISVANHIRKDQIEQKSIFVDCNGGHVNFYKGTSMRISPLIKKKVREYSCTEKKPLHCFMLTNKSVAVFAGFDNIYTCFSETPFYKKNYDLLNTELLNEDRTKLGVIPLFLYKLFSLIFLPREEKILISDLIPNRIYKSMSIGELRKVVMLLKSISGDDLGEIIGSLSHFYATSDCAHFKNLIDNVLDIPEITDEEIKKYIIQELYEESENSFDSYRMFHVGTQQWKLWFDYIMRKQKSCIQYHTYHGTKGLEFQHVVIVMENKFGRENNFFSHFFRKYKNGVEDEKYIRARNLLYVSVTRAIQTLDIIYIDDIKEFEESILEIFGTIKSDIEEIDLIGT